MYNIQHTAPVSYPVMCQILLCVQLQRFKQQDKMFGLSKYAMYGEYYPGQIIRLKGIIKLVLYFVLLLESIQVLARYIGTFI